jgi:hypothetical protein
VGRVQDDDYPVTPRSSSDRDLPPRTGRVLLKLPVSSLLALTASTIYLIWRVVQTRSGADPLAFWWLWLIEAFGVTRLAVELVLAGGDDRPSLSDPPTEPAPGSAARPAEVIVPTDLIVVVRDESEMLTRSALLAARRVDGIERITVIDRNERPFVAALAARLGLVRLVPGADRDIADCANEVLRSARGDLIVADAARVLIPDAGRRLAAAAHDGVVAVAASTTEANARRRVDRAGMGDAELWKRRIVPRLAAQESLTSWGGVVLLRRHPLVGAGGFVTADGDTLGATAARIRRGGGTIALAPRAVARRLATGSGPAGRHRYARELHERLCRLRIGPRPSPHRLDGLAEWSILFTPLRAMQRLAIVGLVWAVLLGSITPFVVSSSTLLVAWSVRISLGVLARVAVSREAGYEPWILNDIRLLTTDLAVGFGSLRRHWRTPAASAAPPGAGVLRVFPRVLQSSTVLVVMATALGFVRISTTNGAALMAVALGIWFLTASSLGRRGVGRAQFRTSYRTDAELGVVSPQGLAVIGMSPVGLDVLSSEPLGVGASLTVALLLPTPNGTTPLVRLHGTVRRIGTVAEGWAAYAPFTGLDEASEDAVLEYVSVASFIGSRSTLATICDLSLSDDLKSAVR